MMKSYSIQQKPCQFIAEGCSYQLQRYKNNLKKQMILQENRKIDRNRLHPAQNNWHKSHSRFYSSLFTKSPGTPLFIGITGGEEWSFTLHNSSQPFTWTASWRSVFYLRRAKYCPCRGNILPRPGTKRNVVTEKNLLQDDYFFLVRESSHLVQERTKSPKTTNPKRAKTSKKGEEWWRVVKSGRPLFTSHTPSIYRHFRRKGEEWRVKYKFAWFKLKLYDGNKINHILLCHFKERHYLCTPNAENRAGLRLRFIIHL